MQSLQVNHSDSLLGRVKEHFQSTGVYARRRQPVYEEQEKIILPFIRQTVSPGSRILEIGGGSGYFLDSIARSCGNRNLVNLEIVPHVYREQVNQNTLLVGGAAQRLPFTKESFDHVVAVNLLHHLVSMRRNSSKNQCSRAIGEMLRVTKKKGHILILERCNRHRFFSAVIFYATFLLALSKLNLSFMGVGKGVIVSFLTPYEIHETMTEGNRVKICCERTSPQKVSFRKKATLLMSQEDICVLIGRKKES